MVRAQLGGSGRHRGEIRQIQGQPLQRSGGSRRLDALDGLLRPLLVTATQQHMGTLAGELQRSLKTNSRVGACDQGNAAVLLSHGISGPTGHRSAANPVVLANPCGVLTSFLLVS